MGGVVAMSAHVVAAEDYSVEEIQNLFQKQKEAFSAAQESDIGQTRGLKLVTVGDVNATSGATAVAQTASAEAGSTTVSTPTDPNKPLVFGQLERDIQINLDIKFGFDSAALADTEKPKLAKMCTAIKGSDVGMLRIVGHTDSSGSDQYNEELSVLRAKEVARHLIEDCGVEATRLEVIGMGERFPYNPDNPRADENRRVEFQALS